MPDFGIDDDGYADLDGIEDRPLSLGERRLADQFLRSAFDVDLSSGWKERLLGPTAIGQSDVDDPVHDDTDAFDVVPLDATARTRTRWLIGAVAAGLVLLAGAAALVTGTGASSRDSAITTATSPVTTTPTSVSPLATITLDQGAAGFWYSVTLEGFPPGESVELTCHDSANPAGFSSTLVDVSAAGEATDTTLCYSIASGDHWVTGGGIRSNTVFWNTPPPPEPPRNLRCTNVDVGRIRCDWDAGDNPSPRISYGLRMDRSVVFAGESNFFLATVEAGRTYTFEVRASDESGVSTASAPATVTAWGLPGRPVVSVTAGDGEITASWTQPTNGGTELVDQQSSLSTGDCGSGSEVMSDESPVTVDAANGIQHRFCVRFRNAVGWGPWGSATGTPRAQT